MEKRPLDLAEIIHDRTDHLLALQEAFVALAHALAEQGSLDLAKFRVQLSTSESHLRNIGEDRASSVLAEIAIGLLDDLALTSDLALGRKKRTEAARRNQPPANQDLA